MRLLKNAGIGLVAGVIATAVMDMSQSTLMPVISSWVKSARGPTAVAESSADRDDRQPESSPEKVARRVADLLGVSLSREGIAEWGNRVHWLYGTQWGLTFAILRLRRTPLAGATFGAVLWLGSDELLLWALGIAEKPTHYPFESHASALAAHVVYGAVLGITLAGLESSNSYRR
ncbi:MAG TPA: hypothetical protein VNE17_13855 [Nitrolancea sp.]|nr:hypothetical protein [Nitrolancea sp.]